LPEDNTRLNRGSKGHIFGNASKISKYDQMKIALNSVEARVMA
jgi:hypothetical protein